MVSLSVKTCLDLVPRASRDTIALEAIKSRLEFALLFWGQRDVAIVEAVSELTDEIEFLVGGQQGEIERRAGHASRSNRPLGAETCL